MSRRRAPSIVPRVLGAAILLLLAALAGCSVLSSSPRTGTVDVVYEGNVDRSQSELDEALTRFFQDFPHAKVKKSSVDDAAYDLERYYRDAGFPFAVVRYRFEERQGAPPLAVFTIEEGPRTRLDRVRFEGNKAYTTKRLRKFFEPETRGLFESSAGWYVESEMRSRVEELAAFYELNGYLDVSILPPRLVLDASRTKARIDVTIHEGTRYHLASVELEGGDARVPAESVSASWKEHLGQPYYDRLSVQIQGRIEEFFADRGFADAKVTRTKRDASPDGAVSLAYRIEPGPLVTVGPIAVTGNRRTSSSFVRGHMALHEGELYSREKERTSFGRLFRSGLFDRVSIRPRDREPASKTGVPGEPPPREPAIAPDAERAPDDKRAKDDAAKSAPEKPAPETSAPETSAPVQPVAEKQSAEKPKAESQKPDEPKAEKAVQEPPAPGPESARSASELRPFAVEIEESPALEAFLEPGWGSYERLRLSAGARQRNLFGSGRILDARGTVGQLAQSGTISLIDPAFFGTDFVSSFTLFGNRRQEPSFERLELGTGFSLSQRFTASLEAALGYQYRRSDIIDVKVVDQDVQDAAEQVNISEVLLSAALDTRDNFFNPREGSYTKVSYEVGSAAIGSQLEFVRIRFAHADFFALDAATTLGVSARGGVISPFGSTDVIPLQERFFNGGENTVRSFRESELGPHDADGHPLGGEGYSVFSAELRRRLAGHFEGAVFYDVGNVVSESRDILGLHDMRQGIGLGLRYSLPVGPIRLDGAVNPDPQDGEARAALHFSVGMAF